MATLFSDLCIYTIKHSADLVNGISATFHENRAWKSAERILERSSRCEQSVVILFAAAERTDKLVAWAVLKKVDIKPYGTDYAFSNLTKFKAPLKDKGVLRKRNGEPLSKKFIRPYAICRTPKFIGQHNL